MKYKTLFRLLVRGFGLVMLAQSMPPCAHGCFMITLSVVFFGRPTDLSWYLGYAVDAAVRAGIGIWLFVWPNPIVNLVIPSNRPYCHECGYELRGIGAAGFCPECGTEFQIKRPPGADAAGRPDEGSRSSE